MTGNRFTGRSGELLVIFRRRYIIIEIIKNLAFNPGAKNPLNSSNYIDIIIRD